MSTNILIAGSTGNLGRALLEVGLERGYQLRAVARRPEALGPYRERAGLEIVRARVTEPDELTGVCDGIDVVISALGVTRQRERASFRDIDYQANCNLLAEARRAGVKRFVFTSGVGVEESLDNAMYKAKKDFELELAANGISHLIIRPSGFFSDMMMILDMARQGTVYLLGTGAGILNPIHLTDLAEYYYDHLEDPNGILEVGGPESYSFIQIAQMAFAALGKPGRVVRVPQVIISIFLPFIRLFSLNLFTEVKAFSKIMTHGAEAPPYGRRTLDAAFREAARVE